MRCWLCWLCWLELVLLLELTYTIVSGQHITDNVATTPTDNDRCVTVRACLQRCQSIANAPARCFPPASRERGLMFSPRRQDPSGPPRTHGLQNFSFEVQYTRGVWTLEHCAIDPDELEDSFDECCNSYLVNSPLMAEENGLSKCMELLRARHEQGPSALPQECPWSQQPALTTEVPLWIWSYASRIHICLEVRSPPRLPPPADADAAGSGAESSTQALETRRLLVPSSCGSPSCLQDMWRVESAVHRFCHVYSPSSLESCQVHVHSHCNRCMHASVRLDMHINIASLMHALDTNICMFFVACACLADLHAARAADEGTATRTLSGGPGTAAMD